MQKIAFIGTGKMASALVKSLLNKKAIAAKSIICADKNDENLRQIEKLGVETTKDNKLAAKKAGIIILSVKPQDIFSVLDEITPFLKNQLIISIAAGIKISAIEERIEGIQRQERIEGQKNTGMTGTPRTKARVIRVMPNLPCVAGEMAAGYSLGKYAIKEDEKTAEIILNAGGKCFFMENENLLDAVTALSGSGPAYFAYFIQALAEQGEELGLPKETAEKLAEQTALGTAKMLLEQKIKPEELIKMVMSPKGTTEAAFNTIYNSKIKEEIKEAVKAAYLRAKELGNR